MVLLLGVCICAIQADEPSVSAALLGLPVQNLVNEFCLDCHSSDDPTADLDLESVSLVAVARNSEVWEKAVRKLRSRQMPPSDVPRPDESTYDAALTSLEHLLDRIAKGHPSPGLTAKMYKSPLLRSSILRQIDD